jgi:hypothetical protein
VPQLTCEACGEPVAYGQSRVARSASGWAPSSR